jgi:hypothetical protein
MTWRRIRYTYVENGVRTHGVHTGEEDTRSYIAELHKNHRDLTYLYVEQLAEWEVEDFSGLSIGE